MALSQTLAELQSSVGTEIHTSNWEPITQEMINEFGKATRDMQWIHVDPERAASESPFKTTVAHGYFTLSLYPMLRGLVDESKPLFPDVKNVINYGINKLRFPGPVPAGSRIKAHCELMSAELIEKYTVEVEGQDRPACMAECVMRLYF